MRHGVSGRKFDQPTAQRMAMFRNLVRSLILHERITTTVPKAKEMQPFAEKLITLGKDGSVHARRKALAFVTDKDVIAKLFDDVAPRYASRQGGYTRVVKLGRRLGDGADMALIEFV
jgi:large subunit ribosomal protein L17